MTLIKLINSLKIKWKILFKISLLSSIIIFLILFFIYPVTYTSVITVLPPEKNQNVGGLSSLLNGADFSSIISGGISNATSQLYSEILKSRTAAEYVINKNYLIAFYGSEDVDEAVKKLQKNLNIEITKEGIIRLNVEVSSSLFPFFTNEGKKVKKISAEISNSYIEALDKINREKLSSKARHTREYIEKEIINTKAGLDSAESALMNFQKLNKTISLPDQVKSSIENAAKIKSEIIKTEIELGIAQRNLRDDNKTIILLKTKLIQLNEQYNKLDVGSMDYLVTFKEIPQLGRDLASLIREIKIKNEVYLLLQQQFYKEKIQENRDLPTIEILDKAIVPKKKFSPHALVSSITGGLLTFFLSFIYFTFWENYKKLNDHD